MIITKLYLYHFSTFETLHPPNSFLVFQAFYLRRLRHNAESRAMIGVWLLVLKVMLRGTIRKDGS